MSKPVAFGYARISKSDGSMPSLSPDAQRATIAQYCTSRHFALATVYTDVAVSGGTKIGERPAGGELCRRLAHRTAKGCHVVVARLDRAWRSCSDALVTVDEWLEAGVNVHLLNVPGDSKDMSTSSGRLLLGMMAMFAEWERGQIQERTRNALGHRKQTEKRWNKVVPLGYRPVTGGAVAPEPEDCLTVYLIDRWTVDGGLSSWSISRHLTRQDRPLPSNSRWCPPEERRPRALGRVWQQKTVWSIAQRMREIGPYRTMVLREVAAARGRGWHEPDPTDGPEDRDAR